MSNAVFPKLAGLSWGCNPVPTWSTVVQRSKNGATTRLQNDPYPLWAFELDYEFLRDSVPAMPGGADNPENLSELQQILGFYNARGGGFDDFLIDPAMLTGDPRAGIVLGGPVGVGDGTTTVFYLQRNCGGFIDEVQNPVGTPAISVDGVVQTTSPYGLTDGGVITFIAAPATGAVITWDGRWMWRVRFSEDKIDAKQFMVQLYELQSMKLEQVKL
jgi:uncharacterized protein (TIGR02217 family)